MTTASTAGAWRQGGGSPDRSFRGSRMPREERAMNPERSARTVPPRREPLRAGRADDRRPPVPRGARPTPAHPATARPAQAHRSEARGHADARPVSTEGGLRGAVAVLGVFLVTLAGAGVDSFMGVGLGMITLAALLGSTTIALLSVRRRDLMSVVVAPPVVFIAVAALNIAMAPSAHFNLPTVATLLIRGFPTMAMATGVAIVLALGRAISRR